MMIVVTFRVDEDLYYAPHTEHDVLLSTTEFTYKGDTVVLQVCRKLGVRLSGELCHEQGEIFYIKEPCGQNKVKLTNRSAFAEKLQRFDKSQTVVEQEMIEKYNYTDQCGHPAEVQIVITAKDGKMSAVIHFKDAEHYKNFVCPGWLAQTA
jgi:hypothetical protein